MYGGIRSAVNNAKLTAEGQSVPPHWRLTPHLNYNIFCSVQKVGTVGAEGQSEDSSLSSLRFIPKKFFQALNFDLSGEL